MNAHENQFVAYLPNKTVRLNRKLDLVGASPKNTDKTSFGFTKMDDVGEIRWIKKEAFAESTTRM